MVRLRHRGHTPRIGNFSLCARTDRDRTAEDERMTCGGREWSIQEIELDKAPR